MRRERKLRCGSGMHLLTKWTRRRFLRAAGIVGGASALLPILPRFGDAQTGSVRRLLLLTNGNGTVVPDWRPKRPDGSWAADGEALDGLASPILDPLLARHRDRLLLLDGIDMAAAYDGDFEIADGASGHAAAATLFTGRYGNGLPFETSNMSGQFPDGPSVDQVIADRMVEPTAVRSLHTQLWRRRGLSTNYVLNYDGAGNPLALQFDRGEVFAQLFGGFEADGSVSEAALRAEARDRRSLELLRGEIGRLRAELPSGDRDRLDAHLNSFDSLEERLGVSAVACSIPPEPVDAPVDGRMEDHFQLIKHAFACDRTRIATFSMSPENNWVREEDVTALIPGWTETGREVHATSHSSDGSTLDAQNMTAVSIWHANHVARLLDILAEPDPSGASLLDDTIVVWAMPMSHGGHHSSRGTTVVIAQGRNGPFRTNRYLRWGSFELMAPELDCEGRPRNNLKRCSWEVGCEANNRLLVSLCHAFGHDDVTSFGDPRFTGPLPGLV